jgi:hypothetical protein
VKRTTGFELVTSDEASYRPGDFVSGDESLPVRRVY